MILLFTHHATPTPDEHNASPPVFDSKARRWLKRAPRVQPQTAWTGPAGILGRSGQGLVQKERKLGLKEMSKLEKAYAAQELARGII
jgi:hypothetical protein